MSGIDVIAVAARLRNADPAAADLAGCGDLLRASRILRGWLDAVEARVTSRLDELHRTGGVATATDVHTCAGGVSAAEARRRQRRSKAIDDAPSFGAALATGEIGAEHVDALANATSHTDGDVARALLDNETSLLTAATSMTPEAFGRHVRDHIRGIERDNGLDRNARQRHTTYLTRRRNVATGMVEGRFAFHPELANQIFAAVDREVAAMIIAAERDGDPAAADRSVDRDRLAAEALGRLVASGNDRVRPLVADITVIVDADTLTTGQLHDHSTCETADGLELPPASVARLLCNGVVTPIIVDRDGNVLNAGRSIRHANRQQRRALRAMYRHCAFHGCDVAFDRCEIHHIQHWEQHGRTDLDNLIPLCSRHHHTVHELGYQLHLTADRTLIIIRPDGTEHARTRPDLTHHTRNRHQHPRPPDRQPAA